MSACSECAKKDTTCCSSHGSGIFVTLHDAVRIKKSTGLDFNEFIVFAKAPDDWLETLKKNNDPFLDFYINGKILQLRLKDNGCFFLKTDGCSILNARPGLCRVFPLQVIDGKILLIKDNSYEDENCVLVKNHFFDPDGTKALKELGEDEAEFKAFSDKYDEECELYEQYAPLLAKGVSFEEVIKQFSIEA